MKIVVLDNYDSFTFNLVHYLEKYTDARVDVYRNDEISIEQIQLYDAIVLSPGPGLPEEAGILLDVVRVYAPTKKILGICLGMQAIGLVFGAKLKNLEQVHHGVASSLKITQNNAVFENVSSPFLAGRYHSWVINKAYLPACLKVICEDENGEIMGVQHEQYHLTGLQFHPESVLTEYGEFMIKNWLNTL
jgi:anthranilate synthase component II